ncbi:MAG TPA: nuclear transport factor 2 family protein [Alphaproteobacteria bacterium]|nr:nuclear transport factor 2 family protein [Alphaproteobacteria bacterium]
MSIGVTLAQEVESFATHEAIAATLQRYIDGARAGKGSLMRLAFADGARVRGTYGGKPVEWTLQDFCDIIDKSGPAADLDARIVAIEYEGTAAMARLEARNWRGTRYTDFFVLVKQGDVWQISSKVFFAHSRA